MPDQDNRTTMGEETMLATDVVEEFRKSLHGKLLAPDSEGYDEARTIWNGMIDRRPALIARCTNADDVVQSVNFAREHNLLLAVRGGGHNIAGNAVCDNGLMIDLSLMNSVQVDPQNQTARVGGGTTLGEFDKATQEHGLATPVGINSTTGVAGLTLGGGFGWLSRRYGLSIDNLISADIVTADGSLLRASENENPDLFWGIRGGGGNFGVVTTFEFKLHKVGPEVLAGLIVHPLDDARKVFQFYRDFIANSPEECACWFVLRQAPPFPFLPEEWHGKNILGLAVCYFGDIAEGESVLKPLRDFGNPIADIIGPMPYTAWQSMLDAGQVPGERNYWKSNDFTELSDGLIDVFIDYASRLPDPQSEIACANLGDAVERVPIEATAYTHRNAHFVTSIHGRWNDPANDEECIAWARDLNEATAPFSTGGVYVNFLTKEEGNRVRAAYGPNYERLVAVKNKYDPTNLFQLNQNIQPTTV